jgi:glutathione S-transferase
MLLYDLAAGMNTRRVRIFLAEKGVTVPMHKVDSTAGENATPEFKQMNPLGRLPVLKLDDGSVLTESIAICRYFEALHPEPPLFGRTALEQAQVEMWTRRLEFHLVAPIADVFQHTSDYYRGRFPQLPEVGPWARERAAETLTWLDTELADRRFFAGDHYTMADIVAQCAFVLGKAVGVRMGAEHTHLARWFAEAVARPTARA